MKAMSLPRHPTLTMGGALIFWAIAAAAVAAVHRNLETRSPAFCVAVSAGAIVAIAFLYVPLIAREATLDQTLVVGITWALLAIVAELVEGSTSLPGAYPLFGSPAHDNYRNLLVIAWIIAPALFARRRP